MCPGMTGVEGTTHGHDAVAVANAEKYFAERGMEGADAFVTGDGKTAEEERGATSPPWTC